MSRQLDLFPRGSMGSPGSVEEDINADREIELNTVDEIFSSDSRFRLSSKYIELLKFIARFPNYSTFNCFLMYIQNSEVSCVATARTWARKHRRRPRVAARPLIILAPMAPVRFVYDLKDTEGQPVPENMFQPLKPRTGYLTRVYETTLHNCGVQGISVHETRLNRGSTDTATRITPALRKKNKNLNPKKDSSYLILLNQEFGLAARYSSLVYELGHIFCGHLGIDTNAWWPERGGLNVSEEEIEAGSVAYLVTQRMGLFADAQKYLDDLTSGIPEIPAMSLNAVLQAVTYVEDMGKLRWGVPKRRSRY